VNRSGDISRKIYDGLCSQYELATVVMWAMQSCEEGQEGPTAVALASELMGLGYGRDVVREAIRCGSVLLGGNPVAEIDGNDFVPSQASPGIADTKRTKMETDPVILKFFAYSHLPQRLQAASEPFAVLARHIVDTLPDGAERAVALRKLLESKDAAVRAAL